MAVRYTPRNTVRNCRLCDKEFKPRERNNWYCDQCPSGEDYADWSLNYKKRLYKLFHAAKHRAKTKNLPIDISPEYLIEIWDERAKGRCELTNQPFDLKPWGDKGQVNPRAPSLDRIEPKLGYVKGNVRLITYHMNVALTDFGTKEFEILAKAYFGIRF